MAILFSHPSFVSLKFTVVLLMAWFIRKSKRQKSIFLRLIAADDALFLPPLGLKESSPGQHPSLNRALFWGEKRHTVVALGRKMS